MLFNSYAWRRSRIFAIGWVALASLIFYGLLLASITFNYATVSTSWPPVAG